MYIQVLNLIRYSSIMMARAGDQNQ